MSVLETRLSISMATMAVLGALLLGIGQENFALPALILAVAILSVYFTDIRQTWQLDRTVANLAALVAVGLSALDFTQLQREEQLLAVANLLVYLQVVVFFQQKRPRTYWQLASLSLLQVIVAAALGYSIWFGLLLFVYLLVTIFALSLFLICRETHWIEPRPESKRRSSPVVIEHLSLPDAEGLARLVAPRALMKTTRQAGMATLLIAALVFFALPRFGSSNWGGSLSAPQRVVGFSETVELGELGQVSQDPQTVMQVQLFPPGSNTPLQLDGPLYLRGSVLVSYSHTGRRWQQARRRGIARYYSLPWPANHEQLPRQRITLEPVDQPVVCYVHPAHRIEEKSRVRYETSQQKLIRWPEELRHVRLQFDLGTSGIVGRQQPAIRPQRRPLTAAKRRALLQMPRLSESADPLAGLRTETARVLSVAGTDGDDRLAVARQLAAHLSHQGGFEYSLAPRTTSDPALDPVVEFLLHSKRGHCEYFASALALMLRSQNIPARVVVGYKVPEWNPLGNYYRVRQLHAHTWVEAYFDRSELPDQAIDTPDALGAWIRFDPTTAALAEGESLFGSTMVRVNQALDYVEMLWMRYVIQLDHRQQQRSVYRPVTATIDVVRQWWRSEQAATWQIDWQSMWEWLARQAISWRGMAMLVCLILLSVAAIRRLPRQALSPEPQLSTEALFYRRLERILAQRGYRKTATQTPREYAAVVGGELAMHHETAAVATLPRVVVDAFYRVRFGQEALDSQAINEVERSLDALQRGLDGVSKTG